MEYNVLERRAFMETKQINSDHIRGHIDAFILKILSEKDSYGYEIVKLIYKKSGCLYELKEPSLYTSLKRLEKEHFIKSYWGDETQGGRRKYYHITQKGSEQLEICVNEWINSQMIIDRILTGGKDNGQNS